MSRLLEDFILGALLGDRESEDWALAMLGPWLEGEGGEVGAQMQMASAPAVTPSPGYEIEPMAVPAEPMVPGRSPGVSAPVEMRPPEPRWWEHATRLEKRYHWHLERGRSPEQARQLVEQERRVLESDIADPWSYLSYAATFGDEKYGKGGQVKRWDELGEPEHALEGWFRSQGLGEEEAQRRAAEEGYLLGPEGPANLKSWLRHLGSLGPSMYDEEGRLKQPGTFATGEGNLVSDVIYGSAEEMSRAQAERAAAEMMRLAPEQLAPAQQQGVAWTLGDGVPGPTTGELARGVASAGAWGVHEGIRKAGGQNIAAGMVAADTVARGKGETGRWIVDFPYAYRKSLRDIEEHAEQARYQREATNVAKQHPVSAFLASLAEQGGEAAGEAAFSYLTGKVTGPILNRALPINPRSGAVDRFGRGLLGGVVGAGIKGETDPQEIVTAGLKSGSGRVAGDLTRAALARTSSLERGSLPYRGYTEVPAAGAQRGAKGLVGRVPEVPEDRRGAMRGLGLMEAYAAASPERRIAEMELREAEERRRYLEHDAVMRDWFQEVGHERAAGELMQAMTPEAARSVIRLYTDLPEEEIWRLAPDER